MHQKYALATYEIHLVISMIFHRGDFMMSSISDEQKIYSTTARRIRLFRILAYFDDAIGAGLGSGI